MSTTTSRPAPGTNLANVVGTLTRPPEARPLPSGDTVVALELSVRPDDRPAESVPVAWFEPPAAVADWAPGEEVLVVGRVRRRFFRAGGVTQSRTVIVAGTAVPTRRAATASKALRAAVAAVGS
jgi:single-strand DNA-binding protein